MVYENQKEQKMQLPEKIGRFHIIGIGGIGMSAIAEIMLARGYKVQGSDIKSSVNTQRLQNKGAKVFIGHSEENISDADYVIISTAVKPGNPEYDQALRQNIPIIRRAEILAELMRSKSTISVTGTHGKTTTTSLISTIIEEAALEPTVINGGIINRWNSNARVGSGDWMIVEADESDGTFVRLPTQIGIVTNIDPEHLDYYGSVEGMHAAFNQFFTQIPFYGLIIACIDHPVVRTMVEQQKKGENSKRFLTYGQSADADIRLENLRPDDVGVIFDVVLGGALNGHSGRMENVKLSVPGIYNAFNALAAIGVAVELDIDEHYIRSALENFSGVKRRFTNTGEWNGVRFYDDYAHHPVEISSVLKAASNMTSGNIIAVMQPHRYSRLQSLFNDFCSCFSDADKVIITPVYAAGEAPIQGIGQHELVEGINATGATNAEAVKDLEELISKVKEVVLPGDLVIGLGAGTITEWAHELPTQLIISNNVSPEINHGSTM